MTLMRRIGAITLLTFLVLACPGCGAPTNSLATPAESKPASTTTAATTASESDPPARLAKKDSSGIARATTVDSPNATTVSVESAGQPKTNDSPSPQPTAEQRTRWKPAPFDPLRLLACHENDDAGFVAFVAPTNDRRQVAALRR